jgi:putative acetyltransferase
MEPALSIKICNASNNDFPKITALVSQCLAEFNRHFSLKDDDKDLVNIESTYLNAGGIFLVAKDDSNIIGTVAVLPYAPGTAMIKKMYIDKLYRGKGLGKRLMDEVLHRCPQLGIKKLYLETLDEMTAAKALYKKYGFDFVRQIDNNARCDWLMMRDI